jgi:DNA polymerase
MPKQPPDDAGRFLPERRTYDALRAAAAGCTACDLYARGTQTVFGEGRTSARVIFVGEQPGDYEDRTGHPFVGPAGKLLDRALEEAGIERTSVYVTNAVKHFKWEARGKRRIHSRPSGREIRACRPWLEAEIELVHPEVIVCLGATAAQALLGPKFRVTESRGVPFASPWGPKIVATVHPSAILRERDDEARHRAMAAFVDDLRAVKRMLR